MEVDYQLLVIGGGPGGYSAAIRGAQCGLRTALVEQQDIGGTCLNRGCIPTKALLHGAQGLRESQDLAACGLKLSGAEVDFAALSQYKDDTVAYLRGNVEGLLKANGVTILRGQGRLLGSGKVAVAAKDGEQVYTCEHIIIATGSRPAMLPFVDAGQPGVVTSDGLLALDKLPERLVIIGGGVIGVEFATAFSAFGSKVTILEGAGQILPQMEADIAKAVAGRLAQQGVAIHVNAGVDGVKKVIGSVRVGCRINGEQQVFEGDRVLISIGRVANTEGLGLEEAGIALERRGIVVDENLRTNLPGVYAIGDVVAGNIQLAHVAAAQGLAAVQVILSGSHDQQLDVVPACLYTKPEVATVGLTRAEAVSQGFDAQWGSFQMYGNGKSIVEGDTDGFIRIVFDAASRRVLGAQLVCQRATDIIAELALAVANGLTVEQIARVIHPHPTFVEAVLEAAEDSHGLAIHALPRTK